MITKNIKHFIVAGTLCCGLSATFTACSDWSDHYEGADGGEGSGATLWEQLKADAQLSDFCEVLEQTKVFRMHKKTSISYAELLNSGEAFTVVAPVNGTFDKDAYLQLVQTNQGDSIVEKFFVKNHLSGVLASLTPTEKSMLLLNSKHVSIGDNAIEGVTVSKANQRAKNGVLHVVNGPLPYRYSLYESLCDIPEMNTVGEQLRIYDEDYFDADASVSSGIVEGVPVYVDSVVVERNRFLQRVGLLAAEDSTYWVVSPSNTGWNEAWAEASTYFQYDEKVLKRDSLNHYWTTYALLSDGVLTRSRCRRLMTR